MSFVCLFHLIYELFGIFMVMINIVKIELINATENRLLNISQLEFSFPQMNYSFFIPFSFSQDQGI